MIARAEANALRKENAKLHTQHKELQEAGLQWRARWKRAEESVT